MNRKIERSILNYWMEKEKRIEAAHLLDLCENAVFRKETVVTPFLGPGMSGWLKDFLEKMEVSYLVFGGFPDAERNRLVIGGNKRELHRQDANIFLLRVIPVRNGVIFSHRQLLGSLMGLGLERSVIGDIRQGEPGVFVAVASEITPYIIESWKAVGREKIKAEIWEEEIIDLPVAGVTRRITAASSRLDAVAAAGFGVSRTAVKEWIGQGRLKRNDITVYKPDIELRAGDIISCRGKGKIQLLEEEDKTRKGRNAWKIFIYKDV